MISHIIFGEKKLPSESFHFQVFHCKSLVILSHIFVSAGGLQTTKRFDFWNENFVWLKISSALLEKSNI